MYGLVPLGIVHLAISLIAVFSGFALLVKDRKITAGSTLGWVYVVTTALTCATALGIYQHGGFGRGHILAVITLVVLALALAAGKTQLFGRASRYVETIGFSATLLFHMIPAIAEGATRLPYGAPLAASPEDPVVKMATGVAFLIFIAGVILQVRSLRSRA